MVLTIDVSPPGTHSVHIMASTGGEATVNYTIIDVKTDSK